MYDILGKIFMLNSAINKSSSTIVVIIIQDFPKSMSKAKEQIQKIIYKEIEVLWNQYNRSDQLNTFFSFEIVYISNKHYELSKYQEDITLLKEKLFKKAILSGGQVMIAPNRDKDKLMLTWKEIKQKHFIELLDRNGVINYARYNKNKIIISDSFKDNMNTLKERSKKEIISSFKSIIDSTILLIKDKLAYETRYCYLPFSNILFNQTFTSISNDILLSVHSQELRVFKDKNRKLMRDIDAYIKKYKMKYDLDYFKDMKDIIKSNIKDYAVTVLEKKVSLDEDIPIVRMKLAKYLFNDYYRITKELYIDIVIERHIRNVITFSFNKFKEEIVKESELNIWSILRRKIKKIIAKEVNQFKDNLQSTSKYNDEEISQYEEQLRSKAYKEVFDFFVSFLSNQNNLKKIVITFFIYNFSFFHNNKEDWRKWFYYTKESVFYLYNKKLDASFEFLRSILNITIENDNDSFRTNLNDNIKINSIFESCSPIIEEIYNESQLICKESTFTLSYIIYFFVFYYVYNHFELITNSSIYLFIVFLIFFLIICHELKFNYYSHYLLYSFFDKISSRFPFLCPSLKRTNSYHTLIISNLLIKNDIQNNQYLNK